MKIPQLLLELKLPLNPRVCMCVCARTDALFLFCLTILNNVQCLAICAVCDCHRFTTGMLISVESFSIRHWHWLEHFTSYFKLFILWVSAVALCCDFILCAWIFYSAICCFFFFCDLCILETHCVKPSLLLLQTLWNTALGISISHFQFNLVENFTL